MNRLPSILPENFTQAQQDLFEGITGGKRGQGRATDTFLAPEGGLRGPFNALLFSPTIGNAAQRLGEAVRFESALPPRIRELAILAVSAKWQAQYEWWAHEKFARQEGLDDRVIEAIKVRDFPDFADPTEEAAYSFAREVIDEHRVSDAGYQEVVKRLGEELVVELVILLGYYTLISMSLNVFEVPLPAGEELPFLDAE